MQGHSKDDSIIMKAIAASNRGQHGTAAALYQQAGNQIRNPREKQELWNAANKARSIRDSD